MKKIVVFLLLLLPLMATADPIDLQSAKRKAGAFLKEKVSSIIDKPMNLAYRQPLPDNEEKTAFYIFNSSDGKGYVIVSGDDRTEQVLGYSVWIAMSLLSAESRKGAPPLKRPLNLSLRHIGIKTVLSTTWLLM